MDPSIAGMRAAVCGLALCLPAFAPAHGAPKAACLRSAVAAVTYRERVGDTGDDIAVRLAKPGQPAPAGCAYKPAPTDWIVAGKDDPFYPLALRGRYLAVDVGTGGPRDLKVFDVVTRKAVVTARYDNGPGRFRATADAVNYWAVSPDRIAPAACPAAYRASPDAAGASEAHRTAEMRLSVADGALEPTGATGCVPVTEDE